MKKLLSTTILILIICSANGQNSTKHLGNARIFLDGAIIGTHDNMLGGTLKLNFGLPNGYLIAMRRTTAVEWIFFGSEENKIKETGILFGRQYNFKSLRLDYLGGVSVTKRTILGDYNESSIWFGGSYDYEEVFDWGIPFESNISLTGKFAGTGLKLFGTVSGHPTFGIGLLVQAGELGKYKKR